MLNHGEYLNHIKWGEFEFIKNNKKIEYMNIEASFDIETTSTYIDGEKVALPYIWQFGIGLNNGVCYGRTLTEFVELLDDISLYYDLSLSRRLIIYVHNLAYEFQYIYKFFEWVEGGIFSMSERKPLKALTTNGIEFRCSYMLSGSSLATTAKNLTTYKVSKMVGDLDYSRIRHEETPLTDEELKYCENDVLIVLSYIKEQINFYSNDINRLPLTNTGRVRNYVRDKCYNSGKSAKFRYRKIMKDLTLTSDDYTQLKRAFMGGFTHANANKVGYVLNDVTSIDFTSAYPSVMLSEKYPMTRFKPIEVSTVSEFEALIEQFALVFDINFINLRPKINQENYISESKCFKKENVVINNGRVSSADLIGVTLIDTDYKIMKMAYEWDYIEIYNLKYAHKAYLPRPIINSVSELYQDKTQLKGVAGSEVEYLLSKGMLNSIYGMCVTDVVKENALFDGELWSTETPDIEAEIEKYNNSYNRFLYYPWGVWVTGYARLNLWTGIIAVGDDYIYSDTDSLKLTNYEKHLGYINNFNNDIHNKMLNMVNEYKLDPDLLTPKTVEGVEQLIGVWDYEGTYSHFKTLGSKRYLVKEGEKYQLTVAGLNKANGMNYLIEQGITTDKIFDLFNNELYIPPDKTGKMTHSYIDEVKQFELTDYLGNTKFINSLSSLHLSECEYTLSLSRQYLKFIESLSQGYILKAIK